MDVTRDNFAAVYPKFKELLDTCKFLSFDEEMTGINGADGMQQKRDDTPQIRFSKMIEVATKYSIIQFGVCLFHESPDGASWEATPYNFYLFPNSGGDLVVSPSSIDFLRKNGMDFGMWMSKGITFVDAKREQGNKNWFYPPEVDKAAKQLIVPTRPSDIEYVAQCMSKVTALLASSVATIESDTAMEAAAAENTAAQVAEVILQPGNSYLRRILYEQLEAQFPEKVNVSKNDQGHMVVRAVDPATQEAVLAAKKAEKDRQFFDAIGFRRVFTDMVEAQKPIVGHNLFFDLLFMMRWLDNPLPMELDAFRADLYAKFPYIYDTKYIAALAPDGVDLSSTALEDCYKHYVLGVNNKEGDGAGAAVKAPYVKVEMSQWVEGYNAADPQYHNAGYDAYVTGCVFANQVRILQTQTQGTAAVGANSGSEGNTMEVDGTATTGTDVAVGLQSAAQRWANTIYMMRSCYHLQLTPSLPAGRLYLPGTLLRVSGFDGSKVNTNNVIELLSGAGLKAGRFEILWVDKESFLIHVPLYTLGESRAAPDSASVEQQLMLTTAPEMGSVDPMAVTAGPASAAGAVDAAQTAPATEAVPEAANEAQSVAAKAAEADPEEVWVSWPAGWEVVPFDQYQEARTAAAAQLEAEVVAVAGDDVKEGEEPAAKRQRTAD